MGSCLCLSKEAPVKHASSASLCSLSGESDVAVSRLNSIDESHLQTRGNLLVCSVLVLSLALFRFEFRLSACLLFFVACILRRSWLLSSSDLPCQGIADNDLETVCNGRPLFVPPPKNDEGVSLSFRVSDEEASQIRARGGDPYIGLRLNYLGETTVPFEPLLRSLNAKQRKAFETFQRVFPSKLDVDARLNRNKFFQRPDQFTMLIFLQADNYDIELAVERLIATMVWRQSNLDDFIDKPDLELYSRYLKYRPKRMVGFDKLGRPLIIERLGEFFGSDNGERGMTRDEWAKGSAFELSLVSCAFRKSSVHENRAIHRLTYIGDLTGLRVRQARNLLPFLQFVTQCVERYFPETAGSVILVNAPMYFWCLLKIASLFIPRTIMANLSVHSDNPHAFLRDKIGPQVLPREWGGDSDIIVPHITPAPPDRN